MNIPPDFENGEILLVDKPLEWTSFDVVNYIRNFIRVRILHKKIKVGHAGTLDPLATGLLILCTGKMTRNIDAIQLQEKEYTGIMTLGATTPSFDLETSIDAELPWDHIHPDEVVDKAASFLGNQMQTPPMFSAIKISGKRAYDYARRKDTTVKPPEAKEVHIHEFEIVSMPLPDIHFRLVVSKGTYIRSLVNDFGKSLGSGAYLKSLRRTRIGDFRVEGAMEPKDLTTHIINIIQDKE